MAPPRKTPPWTVSASRVTALRTSSSAAAAAAPGERPLRGWAARRFPPVRAGAPLAGLSQDFNAACLGKSAGLKGWRGLRAKMRGSMTELERRCERGSRRRVRRGPRWLRLQCGSGSASGRSRRRWRQRETATPSRCCPAPTTAWGAFLALLPTPTTLPAAATCRHPSLPHAALSAHCTSHPQSFPFCQELARVSTSAA